MNNRTMTDASFATKYNAMLDGIYAAGEQNGKKPKIILLSPTPLSGEFGISTGEFGSDITTEGYYDSVKRFSENLSSIAGKRGLKFVDLRQAMVDESANLGDRYAMFEAIHGSAPRMIERGMGQYANPDSILKAAALLLRHICRTEAADKLEKAIADCPLTVKSDGSAATCAQYADAIMQLL
jgi:hypothetical protein